MDVKFHSVPTEVQLRAENSDDVPKGTAGNPFIPMEVTAAINDEGLGLTMWWSEAEAEPEPEAMDE